MGGRCLGEGCYDGWLGVFNAGSCKICIAGSGSSTLGRPLAALAQPR